MDIAFEPLLYAVAVIVAIWLLFVAFYATRSMIRMVLRLVIYFLLLSLMLTYWFSTSVMGMQLLSPADVERERQRRREANLADDRP